MEILKKLENSLREIIENLKQELAGIRTNRPTAKLVEDIKVDYFGQILTIKQMGSISIVPPREIDITVWDRQAVSLVVKAIESSKLGISANIDGNIIKVNLPQLTDERRQELIKLVKSLIEESRIKIRARRDEINKQVEALFKEKKISEDQKFKNKDKIQEAIDKANKEIEKLLLMKIKEINE